MSGGKSSGGSGEDSWGSKFFKVAGAAAATAAVAGGLYAFLSSSAPGNSELEVPFQATRWTKPELGWVKLNVDGSRAHEDLYTRPSAGCGGVLRGSSGEWLLGFSKRLDPTFQPDVTEIWAILTGLQVALKRGVKRLKVESDCKTVVELVNNGCKNSHPQRDIINQVKELLACDEWQASLEFIDNEANDVADWLANYARRLPDDDLHVFSSPPLEHCSTLVSKDAQGESF